MQAASSKTPTFQMYLALMLVELGNIVIFSQSMVFLLSFLIILGPILTEIKLVHHG